MSVGIISKADALYSLRPGAQWILTGDVIKWLDTIQTQPTESEIDAEIVRLQAEYNANQYQRDRVKEYPPLAEQLDLLYHDRINSTDTWMEAIQAVKNKYPKS
jgi:hypothetical protein